MCHRLFRKKSYNINENVFTRIYAIKLKLLLKIWKLELFTRMKSKRANIL